MYEQISESSGIAVQQTLHADEFCEVFRGRAPDSNATVRVIAFTSRAFSDPRVREAYKSDRARLHYLRHASIARFLRDVEFEDRLCFLQESRDWPDLGRSPRRGTLTTDDIVETGWQLCSALQQAHNAGVFHGAICERSVLLSDDLRVLLCDFRLEYWRRAGAQHADAEPDTADSTDDELADGLDSISLATAADLLQLVQLLMLLVVESENRIQGDSEAVAHAEDTARLAALKQLLQSLLEIAPADWSYTARDVQGLLGEILIGDGQEAMAVVDRRMAESRFRSSIVEDLFDETPAIPTASDQRDEGRRLWKPLILPILLGALLAVILLWAAGLLA